MRLSHLSLLHFLTFLLTLPFFSKGLGLSDNVYQNSVIASFHCFLCIVFYLTENIWNVSKTLETEKLEQTAESVQIQHRALCLLPREGLPHFKCTALRRWPEIKF